jgi:hypothetical protein
MNYEYFLPNRQEFTRQTRQGQLQISAEESVSGPGAKYVDGWRSNPIGKVRKSPLLLEDFGAVKNLY